VEFRVSISAIQLPAPRSREAQAGKRYAKPVAIGSLGIDQACFDQGHGIAIGLDLVAQLLPDVGGHVHVQELDPTIHLTDIGFREWHRSILSAQQYSGLERQYLEQWAPGC
jgi:hypothetical protein